MSQYKDFIPQNVAPKTAKCIRIYDSSGVKRGTISLGNLRFPTNVGEKKYSFGAISDIHLQNDTAQDDFQRALTYFNETEDVDFTCIAGDLTDAGTASQLATYKQYVDTYSPNTPVYAITGNHEGRSPNIIADFKTYASESLYYSFEHNDDVFIMVGCQPTSDSGGWPVSGSLLSKEELQWLYDTLEANRNKRCFVFQHVRPQDGCGNAFSIYSLDIWGGTEQTVFESLMHHYKNAHHFHGHSHLKFYLQYGSDVANIDHLFGGWSIHSPSLAVPRDGDPSGASSRKEVYADSEGYVVDVYESGIHLRGRDFVKSEFLPIASYWLDTTLQDIPERSYTDPTGTIVTEDTTPKYINILPLAIASDKTPYNGGQGWKTNTRLNSSGAESTSSATSIEVTGFIPVKNGDTVYLKDITLNYAYSPSNTYIWLYDSSFAKVNNRYVRLGDYGADFVTDRVSRGLIETDSDGNWTKIVIDGNVLFKQSTSQGSMDTVAYIRFSCHEINADSIVTVNEPID